VIGWLIGASRSSEITRRLGDAITLDDPADDAGLS